MSSCGKAWGLSRVLHKTHRFHLKGYFSRAIIRRRLKKSHWLTCWIGGVQDPWEHSWVSHNDHHVSALADRLVFKWFVSLRVQILHLLFVLFLTTLILIVWVYLQSSSINVGIRIISTVWSFIIHRALSLILVGLIFCSLIFIVCWIV